MCAHSLFTKTGVICGLHEAVSQRSQPQIMLMNMEMGQPLQQLRSAVKHQNSVFRGMETVC